MTPAEEVLRGRIETGGPVRFDEVMEVALYDPEVGFYGRAGRAGGRQGDFVTSPETGPLFGELVGRFLDAVWHDLGRPDRFGFIDAGAGPGTLARTVLAAEPACSATLEVVCVERSAVQRAQHPAGVESRPDLPTDPVTGVIFANELLDNLPVRVVERVDASTWVERAVGVVGGSLGWVRGEPIAGPGATAFAALARDLPVGSVVPWRLGTRPSWWADASARLDRGCLVVIDYAATTADLAERGTGWLRTYRGHQRGTDPFDGLGTRDLTTDVPFDQLLDPAPAFVTTQAAWLGELGIDGLVDEGRRIWSERASTGDLAAMKARSRIAEAEALTDPAGLGGFAVLQWVV